MNDSTPSSIAEVDSVEHCHKDLRDEIQLYWIIQFGTITALGALMGTWPKTAEITTIDGVIVKLLVLSVAMILLTVGGMYNIVGNYYTFVANHRLGRDYQESVVTPWLATTQSLIAGILGAGILAVLYEGLWISDGVQPPAPMPAQASRVARRDAAEFDLHLSFVRANPDKKNRTSGSQKGGEAISVRDGLIGMTGVVVSGIVVGFVIYAFSVATVFTSLVQDDRRSRSTSEMMSRFKKYSTRLQSALPVKFGIRIKTCVSHLRSSKLRKAEDQFPDTFQYWEGLTELRIRSGTRSSATFAALQAAKSISDQHEFQFKLAALLAHCGDLRGYHSHVKRLLKTFGTTSQPELAERAAKACLLLPVKADVLGGACRLATQSVLHNPPHRDLACANVADALAAYRSGEFERAVSAAKKAISGAPETYWFREAQAFFVRAMAEGFLGRYNDAIQSFKTANTVVSKMQVIAETEDFREWWHDLLICEILQNEADLFLDIREIG